MSATASLEFHHRTLVRHRRRQVGTGVVEMEQMRLGGALGDEEAVMQDRVARVVAAGELFSSQLSRVGVDLGSRGSRSRTGPGVRFASWAICVGPAQIGERRGLFLPSYFLKRLNSSDL
jgi:hypothetical protein